MLEDSGITEKDLLNSPTQVGNHSYNSIVDKLIRISGEPLIPWMYGLQMSNLSLGHLGIALRSASNLRKAYEILPTLFPIWTGYAQTLATTRSDDFFDVVIRSGKPTAPNNIVRFNTISSLMNIAWLSRKITGTQDESIQNIVSITWSAPESNEEALVNLLPKGTIIKFNQSENMIRHTYQSLQAPVISSCPLMYKLAVEECELHLISPPPKASITDKVRWLFRAMRPEIPTIDLAAQKLNLSPATLKRQLKGERTSFQEEKDLERFNRVIELLLTTKLSLEKIANEVRFENPSNLSKAFRSRFGITPGKFRNENSIPNFSKSEQH